MFIRVVCGFSVTMAIFSPTSALSSVLLPALGRPIMETNPERCAIIPGPAWFVVRCFLRVRGRHGLFLSCDRLIPELQNASLHLQQIHRAEGYGLQWR